MKERRYNCIKLNDCFGSSILIECRNTVAKSKFLLSIVITKLLIKNFEDTGRSRFPFTDLKNCVMHQIAKLFQQFLNGWNNFLVGIVQSHSLVSHRINNANICTNCGPVLFVCFRWWAF